MRQTLVFPVMDRGVFKFRRFSVHNDLAAQKVGTDGVLLGTAVTLPLPAVALPLPAGAPQAAMPKQRSRHILDIGTGTGVVALILSQRLSDAGVPAEITGIDIDAAAAASAAASFAESPWAGNLTALHISLEDFADGLYRAGVDGLPDLSDPAAGPDRSERRFDLIVSNPPYYDSSLPCPDDRRNLARHTGSLSWREVITFAADFLTGDGRLALILPRQEEKVLLRFASSFGLAPVRLLSVSTSEGKPPRRLVAEFVRSGAASSSAAPFRQTMVIGDEEYRRLVVPFYL